MLNNEYHLVLNSRLYWHYTGGSNYRAATSITYKILLCLDQPHKLNINANAKLGLFAQKLINRLLFIPDFLQMKPRGECSKIVCIAHSVNTLMYTSITRLP